MLYAASPEHQVEQGLELVTTTPHHHTRVTAITGAGGRNLDIPPAEHTNKTVVDEQALGLLQVTTLLDLAFGYGSCCAASSQGMDLCGYMN